MIIISLSHRCTIMAPCLAVMIIEKQHSPCDRMKTACIHRTSFATLASHDHRTASGGRWQHLTT